MTAYKIPCEPSPECKYYPDCYEDIHHVFQRAMARSCIELTFCELPDNRAKVCREMHEWIEDNVGWPEYPEREEMSEAIKESSVYISVNKKKKIFGS